MGKWRNRAASTISIEQRLKSKFENLSNRIIHLNRNLHLNSKMNAEKMLQNSVATTRDGSDVSYEKFYSEAYKAELVKVEVLNKERSFIEVDLFLLTKKPLDEDRKDICTNEMMEYYLRRCEEITEDSINGNYNDDGGSSLDEVVNQIPIIHKITDKKPTTVLPHLLQPSSNTGSISATSRPSPIILGETNLSLLLPFPLPLKLLARASEKDQEPSIPPYRS